MLFCKGVRPAAVGEPRRQCCSVQGREAGCWNLEDLMFSAECQGVLPNDLKIDPVCFSARVSDLRLSVSHVGSVAQFKAVKQVAGTMKRDLSQCSGIAAFCSSVSTWIPSCTVVLGDRALPHACPTRAERWSVLQCSSAQSHEAGCWNLDGSAQDSEVPAFAQCGSDLILCGRSSHRAADVAFSPPHDRFCPNAQCARNVLQLFAIVDLPLECARHSFQQ